MLTFFLTFGLCNNINGQITIVELETNDFHPINERLLYLDSLNELQIDNRHEYYVSLTIISTNIDSTIMARIKTYKFTGLQLDFQACIFIEGSTLMIRDMSNLESLTFVRCILEEWDTGISTCPNLTTLRFYGSELSLFPNDLYKLTKLNIFVLSTKVFNGNLDFTYMTDLEELDIYIDDTIKEPFASTLCNLNKLKYAITSWVSVDTILPECIGNLASLSSIYSCEIYPPNSVYNNPKIEAVYISPTSIEMAKYIADKFIEADREVFLCINNHREHFFDANWVKNTKIKICIW